jgi:hypothetical protein
MIRERGLSAETRRGHPGLHADFGNTTLPFQVCVLDWVPARSGLVALHVPGPAAMSWRAAFRRAGRKLPRPGTARAQAAICPGDQIEQR